MKVRPSVKKIVRTAKSCGRRGIVYIICSSDAPAQAKTGLEIVTNDPLTREASLVQALRATFNGSMRPARLSCGRFSNILPRFFSSARVEN